MKNKEKLVPDEVAALIDAAWRAREQAYAPYSGFTVGAAVQAASGQIYGGCNIENVSYGLSNCAERTAMFQAIAHGRATVSAHSSLCRYAGACRSLWCL